MSVISSIEPAKSTNREIIAGKIKALEEKIGDLRIDVTDLEYEAVLLTTECDRIITEVDEIDKSLDELSAVEDLKVMPAKNRKGAI